MTGLLACDAEPIFPEIPPIDVVPDLCEGTSAQWPGDFTVDDWSDSSSVLSLGCARAVTGRLELTGGSVTLPYLEAVGDIVIDPGVREVSLPSLWSVAGHVIAREGVVLDELELPRLRRVGGYLTIGPIQTDAEVVLPALTEVGRDLVVVADTPRLSMPALVHVEDGLNLGGNIDALDLPVLTTVHGRLRIASSTLRDLSGMPALRWVHGDLDFWGTTALERVMLPALHEIDGTLVVHHGAAPVLTEIDLPAMEFFSSELALMQLPSLRRFAFGGGAPAKLTLWSLPALRTVEVPQVGALVVRDTGLEELAIRGGGAGIEIENNPALRRLRLDTGNTSLVLRNNGALTALEAPTLESANLSIHGSPALATLDLPRLASGKVSINGGALPDLRGLGALAWGSLHLSRLERITSLAGLSAAHRLTWLSINDCPALASLAGLAAGATIENVSLSRNQALVDLRSLAAYDLVGSTALLYLADLPITSLAGLERLPQGIAIALASNPALTDIGALGHLRELRSLQIDGNEQLASLAGLAAVRTIAEELFIMDSPAITSLADLGGLASVGGRILINRSGVPRAEAEAFLARLGR